MIRAVDAATFRTSVLRKGFVPASGKRDHEIYVFHLAGQRTAWQVKLSHGAAEITANEIRLNARPLGIAGDDLYRILCCDHDAQKTRELFLEVHPESAPAATRPPEAPDDPGLAAAQERLARAEKALREAASDLAADVDALLREYEVARQALAALKRRGR